MIPVMDNYSYIQTYFSIYGRCELSIHSIAYYKEEKVFLPHHACNKLIPFEFSVLYWLHIRGCTTLNNVLRGVIDCHVTFMVFLFERFPFEPYSKSRRRTLAQWIGLDWYLLSPGCSVSPGRFSTGVCSGIAGERGLWYGYYPNLVPGYFTCYLG